MKELLVVPVFFMLFIGVSMQLVTIAQSTSQKAIGFADDMNKAMDCAVRGIDLKICSPNLFNTSFDNEINSSLEINNKILSLSSKILQTNLTQLEKEYIINYSSSRTNNLTNENIYNNIDEKEVVGVIEINNTKYFLVKQ